MFEFEINIYCLGIMESSIIPNNGMLGWCHNSQMEYSLEITKEMFQ